MGVVRVGLRFQVWLYRRTDGRRAGSMGGTPILLLTTTGRKSGVARVRPVGYLEEGDRLVVCGSNGGSDHPPAWALNLQANPSATVELKADTFPVTASEVLGDEYEALWTTYTAAYPSFARYRTKTSRHLPLFSLTPVTEPTIDLH